MTWRRGIAALAAVLGFASAGDAQAYVGSYLEPVTCPATGLLGSLVPPTQSLQTVGCAIGSADIFFVTRYRRPDGTTLVRAHQRTFVNVPRAIDVDDDLLTDLIVTPSLLSLSHFRLDIDRLAGEVSPLPVSVEAVIDDPTNGGLPRERINLGYDTRDSRAPQKYRAEIVLADAPQVSVTSLVTPVAPGDALAVVGGLFDGDRLKRANPLGGRLRYAPVPPSSSVALTLGEGARIDLTTSAPTVLQATADLVDATTTRRLTARIDQLPSTLSLAYAPTASGRTITTTAAAVIGRLDVTFREHVDGAQTLGAVVHAAGVPTAVTVDQTGERAGTIETNGAFDFLEAGFATGGDPVLGDAANPYVKLQDSSFAAALYGLKRASVDATDNITGDLQLTPAGRRPLTVDIDRPGFRADGTIDSLPEHLTFAADLDETLVTVDGHGQGIDDLVLKAHQTVPFSGRITDLYAHAADLPAAFDLRITQLTDGIEVMSTAPLPLVEVSATDGGVTLPAGDGAGITFTDLPLAFRAGARVHDFERVRISESAETTFVSAKVRSEPFSLRYRDAERTVTGSVDDLPAVTNLAIKPPALGDPGRITFLNSAPIGSIQARIDQADPFIERTGPDPRTVIARAEGLPDAGIIDVETTASGAFVKSSAPIGAIEALITTGPEERLPAGQSGLLVRDLPDRFVVFGRLANVTELGGSAEPMKLHLRTTAPQRFVIDGQLDVAGDAIDHVGTITGAIEDLPAELDVVRGNNGLEYTANAPIAKLDLDAFQLPGEELDGALHQLRLHMTDVPAHFKIHEGFNTGIEALDGARFGTIEVEAWDHGPGFLPPSDEQTTAKLHSKNGRFHALIRTQDLQRALFTAPTQKLDLAFGVPEPQDVLADMTIDDISVSGLIKQPPSELLLDLDSAGQTKIHYEANDDFPEMILRFAVDGTVAGDLNILNLPSELTFCVVAASNIGCDRKRNVFFEHGGEPFSLPPRIATFLSTSGGGPIDASGVVCLPPKVADGVEPPAWDEQGCFNGERIHYLNFAHAKMRDFRFEFAGSDSLQTDEDGDPIVDDVAQVFLDTSGLLTDQILYRANSTENPGDTDDYEFNSLGPDPFIAEDFELMIDSTPLIPEIVYKAGDIDCGSDSMLDPNAGFDVLDIAGPLLGC